MANLGDLDGDGDEDLMIGAAGYESASMKYGAVVVVRMPGDSPGAP